MRFKNRYLMLQVVWQDDAPKPKEAADRVQTVNLLTKVIRNSVGLNFGDLGLGSVTRSLQVKLWSPDLCLLVLRVPRESAEMVWCALTLVVTPVVFRGLNVASSIRLLKQRCLGYVEKSALTPQRQAAEALAIKALAM